MALILGKPLPFKHISEAGKEELEYMEGRHKGIIKSLSTPWSKLDQATMNGIEWNSITTIAGRSGTGKTAILNELETGLFERNKDQKFTVLSFNFEMLARKLVGRKISRHLEMPVKGLYSAYANPKLGTNINAFDLAQAKKYVDDVLVEYPIYYVDSQGSVDGIEATVDYFFEHVLEEDEGLLVTIDHSILVRGKSGEKQLETLQDLGRMINDKKKVRKVAWIILSQLNRDIERVERINNPALHYPQKSDVFGSDALYQYSDVFMVTHNPYALGIENYGPKALPTEGFLYWHFLKTRDDNPFIGQMINALQYNKILE